MAARWTRLPIAILTTVLLTSACARPAARVEPTGVLKPVPVADRASMPLPSGRESIYTLVNAGSIAAADQILRDVWPVPRYEPVALPSTLTWHENPYASKYWRFVFYSLRPTSNLLWAFYRTGDRRYLDKLCSVLRSLTAFERTSRTRDGDGFDDAHALAFRGMVLVNTYVKLARSGDLPPDLRTDLLTVIGTTGERLSDPRNFQGGFNHGFSQAVSLLLIHENFPALDRGNAWRDLALQRIRSTMESTVDADGAQTEKSPFYHFYELAFGLEVQGWARANGIALPPVLPERLAAMVRYSTYVLWPDGRAPMLGSSVALRPIGRADLFDDLMRAQPEFAFAMTAGGRGTPPGQRAIVFPSSGQAILRSPVDPATPYVTNSQLLMDAGPVQGTHSHHEALAINYYSQGRELIVDSGLNTYARGPARDYFQSTLAHNTITVDGRDQGAGPIRAGLTTTGEGWAYQSGVASVHSGVTHRRSVLLLAKDLVLVADSVTGAAAHTYDQLWHLFPGAHTQVDGLRWRVFDQVDQPALDIVQAELGRPVDALSWYGSLNPMQGWYSDRYGQAVPIHVAGYRTRASSAVYLTLLASGPYAGRSLGVTGTIAGGTSTRPSASRASAP